MKLILLSEIRELPHECLSWGASSETRARERDERMRYVSGLIKLVLFFLLLSFAIENSELVALHYYFGYQWQAPLVLIILVVYVLGAATGVTACLGYLFRQRRELQSLREALTACRSLPPPHS
jgi:uncharacterized integral membrane protein